MSKIAWLASYPKSGNTWFRVFLTNFSRNTVTPASINALNTSAISSSRSVFDSALSIESADLSAEEMDRLRPPVYREIAHRASETLFVKIHDAYHSAAPSESLIPSDASLGVVYLVRNPLDVSISLADHMGWSLDRTIDSMNSDDTALASNPSRLASHLRQRLLSWSNHVMSWIDQSQIPVHVVRYEDLHEYPCETFMKAVKFLGLAEDADRVSRAVSLSAFNVLRQQEEQEGFRERSPKAQLFFRSGVRDRWRTVLTGEQIHRVVRDHGAMMRRLGYLEP